MELKDFIAKTISEIAEGVNDANVKMQETVIGYVNDEQLVCVNFDVSISFDENSKTFGGGGLNVAGIITGKINQETAATNTHSNKVQFKIETKIVSGKRRLV